MKHFLRLQRAVEQRWYGKPGLLLVLLPLEWVFSLISWLRRRSQQRGAYCSSVPLVIVGNISIGGTGKTPTTIALIKYLQSKLMRPGVISRGYGRNSTSQILVSRQTQYQDAGDEPLIIYNATQCDIAVGSDRRVCIEALVDLGCNIILSDDGLQHYKMARDKEIVVIDGQRLLGNGHQLPVGPLREKPERLDEVDWILLNTPMVGKSKVGLRHTELSTKTPIYNAVVEPVGVTCITSKERFTLQHLQNLSDIVVLVGLGNPDKFFDTLDALDLQYEKKIFPDHHKYTSDDLKVAEHQTILMTEKDAVKCQSFVSKNAYYLNVEMRIPGPFLETFYFAVKALEIDSP